MLKTGEDGLRSGLGVEKVGVTNGETGAGTNGGSSTVATAGRAVKPEAGHCI